jgi:hypothetical protein
MLGLSEADTCRRYVTPKLQAAGWDSEPHLIREQRSFTDGRIVVAGGRARRHPGKRADYLLCYRADFTIAVVEAKAFYRSPADGMQQAKACRDARAEVRVRDQRRSHHRVRLHHRHRARDRRVSDAGRALAASARSRRPHR